MRWLLVTMVVGSVSHVILLGGYHQRVRWGIVMEGEITRLSIWRGSHVRSGTYRTVYAVLSNEERVQVGADASTFTALTEGQRVPFLVEGDPIRTVQIGAKPTVSISALLGALILQGALLLLYRRAHSRRADNLIR